MSEHYEIAIVGAGPADLSAAARAAACGAPHILMEAAPRIANTVRHYQKAKCVMAEPAALPLRSCLRFAAGPREDILRTWEEELRPGAVERRFDSRVIAIEGTRGIFRLFLATGETLTAAFVVLAIGLQGNIRRLGMLGDDLPRVHYQLEDPDEFQDEVIVVVGAGDAGVEDALALRLSNQVILVNRGGSIVNCTQSNFDAVMAALEKGELECRHETIVERIEAGDDAGLPLQVIVHARQGVEKIAAIG